jgi:hypothetical protein
MRDAIPFSSATRNNVMLYDDPRLATHAAVYQINSDSEHKSGNLQFENYQRIHNTKIAKNVAKQMTRRGNRSSTTQDESTSTTT